MVITIIFPIILTLAGGYLFYKIQKKDEQKGYLLTGLSLEKKVVNPNEIFNIRFGLFNMQVSYSEMIAGVNLRRFVEFGYDYPINIKIENGCLLISGSFNDRDGRMIAQITDNQWTINRDNYCDRNFSRDTLEVVNKDKIPLLQVEIKNGNDIFIGGVFYFPTKKFFMSKGFSTVSGDPAFDESTALKKMKRIFKYPGNKNLGIKEYLL